MRLMFAVVVLLLVGSQQSFSYPQSDTEGVRISEDAERLLLEKQFQKLDKLAEEYRASIKRVKGGNSALYHFYAGLGTAGTADGAYRGKIPAQERQALLEEWRGRTKSVAATISLARYWERVAWTARGSGTASTVSPDQWKQFHLDMAIAKEILAGVDPKHDPYINFLHAIIGRELSAPRVEMDDLYHRSVKAFPNFFHYYSERGMFLQPRWQGSTAELSSFAASLRQIPGGEDGDIAYTYVTMQLLPIYPNEIFRSMGFEAARVNAGYKAREARYGLRTRDWNAWCFLAALSGSIQEARVALDRIGDDWDADLWGSREAFDNAASWIRSNAQNK